MVDKESVVTALAMAQARRSNDVAGVNALWRGATDQAEVLRALVEFPIVLEGTLNAALRAMTRDENAVMFDLGQFLDDTLRALASQDN